MSATYVIFSGQKKHFICNLLFPVSPFFFNFLYILPNNLKCKQRKEVQLPKFNIRKSRESSFLRKATELVANGAREEAKSKIQVGSSKIKNYDLVLILEEHSLLALVTIVKTVKQWPVLTQSVQTGISNLGCCEEGSETAPVCQLSQRDTVFSFQWKGKCLPEPAGSWLIRTRVPPQSLFGLPSCKGGLQILKVLLVQKAEQSLSGWSELCSSNWVGKASVLLVELGSQDLLYKGCSDGRDTVPAGGSVQTSP